MAESQWSHFHLGERTHHKNWVNLLCQMMTVIVMMMVLIIEKALTITTDDSGDD